MRARSELHQITWVYAILRPAQRTPRIRIGVRFDVLYHLSYSKFMRNKNLLTGLEPVSHHYDNTLTRPGATLGYIYFHIAAGKVCIT